MNLSHTSSLGLFLSEFAVCVHLSMLIFKCDDFHHTEPQHINLIKLIDHSLMSDPYENMSS